MLIAKSSGYRQFEIADFRVLFPDTSFADSGPTPEFLRDNNCWMVNLWRDHNPSTEKLVAADPYIENDVVYIVQVEPLSEEELQTNINHQAGKLRNQRNAMLAQCDWTQGKDIPDTISGPWAIYRQALRDVTDQPGFPSTITWPELPGAT